MPPVTTASPIIIGEMPPTPAPQFARAQAVALSDDPLPEYFDMSPKITVGLFSHDFYPLPQKPPKSAPPVMTGETFPSEKSGCILATRKGHLPSRRQAAFFSKPYVYVSETCGDWMLTCRCTKN